MTKLTTKLIGFLVLISSYGNNVTAKGHDNFNHPKVCLIQLEDGSVISGNEKNMLCLTYKDNIIFKKYFSYENIFKCDIENEKPIYISEEIYRVTKYKVYAFKSIFEAYSYIGYPGIPDGQILKNHNTQSYEPYKITFQSKKNKLEIDYLPSHMIAHYKGGRAPMNYDYDITCKQL